MLWLLIGIGSPKACALRSAELIISDSHEVILWGILLLRSKFTAESMVTSTAVDKNSIFVVVSLIYGSSVCKMSENNPQHNDVASFDLGGEFSLSLIRKPRRREWWITADYKQRCAVHEWQIIIFIINLIDWNYSLAGTEVQALKWN